MYSSVEIVYDEMFSPYIPGMQNRLGFLFFISVYFCLTSMSSLAVFISSRSMSTQEIHASYYTALPYFLAHYIVEMQFRLLLPLLFALISYFMVGLQNHATKFIYFS